jgi:hypothetical protein
MESWGQPPKVFVIAPPRPFEAWRVAHDLPRYAVTRLLDPLPIIGLPLVRLVDLGYPAATLNQNRVLFQVARLDHESRVLWLSDEQVRRVAQLWRDYREELNAGDPVQIWDVVTTG